MKKKIYILAGIFGILLLCAVIHLFRMPDLTIVYDYNGNAYTQNVRSPFRKKVKLKGYKDITFVTPGENGYFCYARDENGNGCFLSVEDSEVTAKVLQEQSDLYIYWSDIHNGMYLISCWYDDPENYTRMLINFPAEKIIYNEYLEADSPPEGEYSVECKLSPAHEDVKPTASTTHTIVINRQTGDEILIYSSIGKKYEHIKIFEE